MATSQDQYLSDERSSFPNSASVNTTLSKQAYSQENIKEKKKSMIKKLKSTYLKFKLPGDQFRTNQSDSSCSVCDVKLWNSQPESL